MKQFVLEKAPSFIYGLDEILEGGFPKGRTTLICGGAGTGKTVLGLEFIYRGALAGEPGIFVTFEETPAKLRQNASSLGWDIVQLEKKNLLFILDATIKPEVLLSGRFSLKGLLAGLTGKIKEIGAKRIAIDAMEVILRLINSPQEVRSEMHLVNDWLIAENATVLLTVRPSKHPESQLFEEFFESMSDCVVCLEARISEQITTRRLRVLKCRGSGFQSNEYPYVITANGFHAAPVSKVGLKHKPLGRRISTGIKEFDKILDGGFRKGACILIAGQPGSGKTIVSSVFMQHVCRKGDRVLYIGFEESEDAVISNVESAGIKLKPLVDDGKIEFLTNYPEAMGTEEHYIKALEIIREHNPQHVIVDAISACQRMGGKLAAFEYLMRLLNHCKENGITIIMINQLSGSKDFLEISGNSISSMIDTIIYLDYIENNGERNRFIQVLKSRGSGHSNKKYEFAISDQAITIFDTFLRKGELLTGSASTERKKKE